VILPFPFVIFICYLALFLHAAYGCRSLFVLCCYFAHVSNHDSPIHQSSQSINLSAPLYLRWHHKAFEHITLRYTRLPRTYVLMHVDTSVRAIRLTVRNHDGLALCRSFIPSITVCLLIRLDTKSSDTVSYDLYVLAYTNVEWNWQARVVLAIAVEYAHYVLLRCTENSLFESRLAVENTTDQHYECDGTET
jgi:hypothetical protein